MSSFLKPLRPASRAVSHTPTAIAVITIRLYQRKWKCPIEKMMGLIETVITLCYSCPTPAHIYTACERGKETIHRIESSALPLACLVMPRVPCGLMADIFLRLFVKRLLAAKRAKVIGLPLVLGFA